MPYIPDKGKRIVLDDLIDMFAREEFTGSLNYFLFKLAKRYCKCYRDYRDFIGELEAAKLEIYRRQVAEYENEKIKKNGDVE